MDAVTFELDGANTEELFRQFSVSPLHEFTIKFVGALKDETPAMDTQVFLGLKCGYCGAQRSVGEDFPCTCEADHGAFMNDEMPSIDLDEEGCDQSAPGPFRRDVCMNIEVKACSGMPGWYIAQSDQFTQFGDGVSPYEALQDFFSCMAAHMADLVAYEHELGSALERELNYLRAVAGDVYA